VRKSERRAASPRAVGAQRGGWAERRAASLRAVGAQRVGWAERRAPSLRAVGAQRVRAAERSALRDADDGAHRHPAVARRPPSRRLSPAALPRHRGASGTPWVASYAHPWTRACSELPRMMTITAAAMVTRVNRGS